ncbi:SWIM zinc finger family protein [Candidatus Poriferisodalis sp.]|uniref:SWIM zinc finger family protein n=1 Tax=Candidatus Poriferisodalis sp. TaxID=3101277 RepID=UPI003B52ECEB
MSIADELSPTLDVRMVGDLAGPDVFERGVGYWEDGRVESLAEGDERLQATVRGTVPYGVEMWFDDDSLRWTCSCPAAEDGSFCKHCTAVALSLIYGDEPSDGTAATPSAKAGKQSTEGELLADFVGRLEHERLAEIVLSQTGADWRLREQLLLEARAERGLGLDIAQWRETIDSAFSFGELDRRGYVHYRDTADWADEVNEVIDALAELIDAGYGEAAAELVEHAYMRTDLAMGEIYDEDGTLMMVGERLGDLHFQACEAGSPEPVKLAQRLAKLELNYELEAFFRSAAPYAELLGSAGLAAFRESVEPSWLKIDPAGGQWRTRDHRAREAMIGWALATGDPDALVEAHRRERIRPNETLEIARAYEAAGRDDEAVTWARTGIAEFGHDAWHTGELCDFLARKLREQGKSGAAVDLYWNAFTASPSLGACRTLVRQDDRPDCPDWLERCLRHLRGRLGTSSVTTASPSTLPTEVIATGFDATPSAEIVLVEILLYEGRAEEAWATALQHGTSWQLWMALARAREPTAPRDSIAIYESQALAVINRKKADQYWVAVDLMSRIRRLAVEAGEPALFDSLLHRVRTDHKAKRRLQSEMKDLTPLAEELT